jgi:hypothetical protein
MRPSPVAYACLHRAPSIAIVVGRIHHGATPRSKTNKSNVRPSLPVELAQVPGTAGRLSSPPWPPSSNPRARLAKGTRRDVNNATCSHRVSPLSDDVGSSIARALPALSCPALPCPIPHQEAVNINNAFCACAVNTRPPSLALLLQGIRPASASALPSNASQRPQSMTRISFCSLRSNRRLIKAVFF